MTEKEDKLAGAAYIINFANTIKSLNEAFSIYCNISLELAARYGENADKINEGELQTLKTYSLEVRKFIKLAYVNVCALAPCSKANIETIKTEYEDLKKAVVADPDDYEKIIIALNTFIVEETVKKLFQTSEDFIKEVFK